MFLGIKFVYLPDVCKTDGAELERTRVLLVPLICVTRVRVVLPSSNPLRS